MISLVLGLALAQPSADRLFLEQFGYSQPAFAGYLPLSPLRSFYYQLYPSRGRPAKDPLLLWAGEWHSCSGLPSAFHGHGPLRFPTNSTKLGPNLNAWNSNASLLYLDQPGVGLGKGQPARSDDEAVELYLAAILQLLAQAPLYRKVPLHLGGQGYAGVILPRLASLILAYNRAETTSPEDRIALEGLLLNNPCTHPFECRSASPSHPDEDFFTASYLGSRFFFNQSRIQELENYCSPGQISFRCQQILRQRLQDFSALRTPISNVFSFCYGQQYACEDRAGINQLLNNDSVLKIFNAERGSIWQSCNCTAAQEYSKDYKGSLAHYPNLFEEGIRITVISGDYDGKVPITGTFYWLKELMGKQLTTRPFRVWLLNSTAGGMTWSVAGLTAVTVRAAGHSVAEWQPQLARHVVERHLASEPL